MSTCISRRACADRESFKLINSNGQLGKYIWTEYKCPNIVSDGKMVCTECAIKLPKHKYQSNPKCDHGIIGGPYPSDSKLYGSPFYFKQIKEGSKPMVADEIRAKEAITKAISQMGPRKKTTSEETAMTETTSAPVAVIAVVEKKPKKPRVLKVKSAIPVIAAAESIVVSEPVKQVEPKFIESTTSPKTVSEVIIVKVKKIRCQGKDYYFDSNSGKAYTAVSDGIGPYKGRYNPETETLNTGFPDSDDEDV
jgi:hypothetical protein